MKTESYHRPRILTSIRIMLLIVCCSRYRKRPPLRNSYFYHFRRLKQRLSDQGISCCEQLVKLSIRQSQVRIRANGIVKLSIRQSRV